MVKIKKNEGSYKTIGEIAKELNLINKNSGQLQTHTIRYWETQFKEINPTVRAGRRRYYSDNDLKIIAFIKFLLKDKGLTISGVKKILNNTKSHSIDDYSNLGIYKDNLKSKDVIINKVKNISKILKEIKKLKDG